jgi:hypothetical protein
MILKIFSPKKLAETLAFLLKILLVYEKYDHNIGFQEKRHFFAENWDKSQVIVIITSTPECTNARVKVLRNFGCDYSYTSKEKTLVPRY